MNDIFPSVHAPQRRGAAEAKSEQVPRRPSIPGKQRRLARLGVEVVTEAKVVQVDAQGVAVSGQRIESSAVLWTAGVAPAPILEELHSETDRAGRIRVSPNLEVPEQPGIFVVGDAAALSQDGRPLPGVAQVAIQQGRYVGQLVRDRIEGRTPVRPFRYFDKGNMAIVGRNFAQLASPPGNAARHHL
jgi:NADH dehydrogenase